MANKRSADKQARASVRRRKHNQLATSKARTLEKKFKIALTSGKQEDAVKILPTLQSALDKAAKSNAIHPNKASRNKSRLTKALAKVASKK